jgi:hypothetical protein
MQMDRLISVFSVYDFFSYVLSGGTLIAGCYWAVAGIPNEPGTATVLGLVALAYIAGHLVQAIGARWEKLYWVERGGWPSDTRVDDNDEKRRYDDAFRSHLRDVLTRTHGPDAANLSSKDRFALARADLRAAGAEGRAELMNTLYALTRGLATSSALLTLVFVVAALDERDWEPFGWAALVTAAAAVIFVGRFSEFGYRFADQVWKDFAGIVGARTYDPEENTI